LDKTAEKNVERILVIIPTYNERENIAELIPAVLTKKPELEVLVVDDGSPDGTAELVSGLSDHEPRIHLLRRKAKEGLGRAYVAGFRYALEHGYDLVFEMDADFSHNPKYIPSFLKAAREADLVIGSRYLTGVNVINWPMSRLLLSYFANLFARVVTGLPLRDPTGGYKCIRRIVLESIDLDRIGSEGYSFQIEVNYKAWKMGFRIKEIPIVFYERARGTSKMSTKIIREALLLVWKMRVLALFHPIKPVGEKSRES